jgi:hypothetical protein
MTHAVSETSKHQNVKNIKTKNAECDFQDGDRRLECDRAIYMTYSFYPMFWGRGFCAGIAVDFLQCLPANCLYGGRNRLHIAV